MWIFGVLAIYLFLFILPIGGSVGLSLLAVGVARRSWAGFLAVPVAVLAMRLVPLMGPAQQRLAVALMLLVTSPACSCCPARVMN